MDGSRPTCACRRRGIGHGTATLLVAVSLTGCAGPSGTPTPHASPHDLIAFSSSHEGDPEIYLLALDGSAPERLTFREGHDGYPAFSPDGSRIAFYRYETPTTWSICVMNRDGSDVRRLTFEEEVRDAAPVWSPDGRRIVFSRHRADRAEIRYIEMATGTVHRLGNLEGFGPACSPDGSRIAFASRETREIYVADAGDGANPRRLTHNDGDDTWPSWSPDGTRIAYMSGPREHHQIHVMDADGDNVVPVTDDAYDNWRPLWSPDGTALAYMSVRGETRGIYRVEFADEPGAAPLHLTPFSDYAMQVGWAPAVVRDR